MTILKRLAKKNGEKMKNNSNNSYTDTVLLAIGEVAVSLIVILIYIAIGHFDWTVFSGVILGSIVTIFNFVHLSYSVNKAINKFMALRGDKEMNDEEAAKFAKDNTLKVQNEVAKSSILRTGLMIASLVIAFITKLFSPLATLIPLVMYKPILYATQLIKAKRGE